MRRFAPTENVLSFRQKWLKFVRTLVLELGGHDDRVRSAWKTFHGEEISKFYNLSVSFRNGSLLNNKSWCIYFGNLFYSFRKNYLLNYVYHFETSEPFIPFVTDRTISSKLTVIIFAETFTLKFNLSFL